MVTSLVQFLISDPGKWFQLGFLLGPAIVILWIWYLRTRRKSLDFLDRFRIHTLNKGEYKVEGTDRQLTT